MNIFLGFECSPKADWKEILGDPKKPANWKAETYESKKEELRTKQAETAAQNLMAGQVSQACVFLPEKAVCDVLPGVELLSYLKNITEGAVFGFNVLDRLRLCGWSAQAGTKMPYWIWNTGAPSSVLLVNLYSVSGAKGEGIELLKTLEHWVPDLKANADKVLPAKPKTLAEVSAAAAFTMASKMGLVI